jgi:hypothetical protein
MKKARAEENDLQRARQSWRGRWLRDGFENRLGVVLEVHEKDGLLLEARFQGEKRPRKIAIEPRDDGEFVHPDEVRARYRLVSEEEARRMLG